MRPEPSTEREWILVLSKRIEQLERETASMRKAAAWLSGLVAATFLKSLLGLIMHI